MQPTKEILSFLSELSENNNREWFQENREWYKRAWANMTGLTREVIAGLSDFDPHIHKNIPAEKCLFRIYRDTRFRQDKTPYKIWLGAGMSVNGRKLDGPEYYLHVQPGASFVATGYWRPEKDHLAAIRQEIDYNGAEINGILEGLERGNGAAGWRLDQDDLLKRPPAGYEAGHPDIELLKLKSFTLSCPVPDEVIAGKDVARILVEKYRETYPFKLFIHQAIGES